MAMDVNSCYFLARLQLWRHEAQQVQPLPKVGGCLLGYYSSSSYWVKSR